jgi:hypothetical protein
MHLRRALLLFAVVLAAAAIVSLLSPRKRAAVTEPPPIAREPLAGSSPTAVRLGYPAHAPARNLRITAGEHVELEVDTTVPGEASAFGTIASAEALTPARFDVLAPGPGRYPVTFQPTSGSAQRLATFDVRR